MSNLFSGINARFRAPSSRSGSNKTSPVTEDVPPSSVSPGLADQQHQQHQQHQQQQQHLQQQQHQQQLYASSSISSQTAPRVPPLPSSPSLSQSIGSIGMATSGTEQQTADPSLAGGQQQAYLSQQPQQPQQPLPLWLNPAYAKHIVKGNFMTLSAKPKTVEQGEWIAHQVVEHYRLLWNFVRVVHEKEDDGLSVCNPTSCPRMSAGRNHSYTWLNSRLEPIELPAYEYMALMQRWISGKISDAAILPTDPAGVSFAPDPSMPGSGANALLDSGDDWVGKRSGFPKDFFSVCKTIFLQMFRVYAHLYWNHFVEPFYHLNLEKQLNSCFSHFLLTATALGMLKPEELEPMQLLVDLWAANGTFPAGSKAYSYANLKSGASLLQIGLPKDEA